MTEPSSAPPAGPERAAPPTTSIPSDPQNPPAPMISPASMSPPAPPVFPAPPEFTVGAAPVPAPPPAFPAPDAGYTATPQAYGTPPGYDTPQAGAQPPYAATGYPVTAQPSYGGYGGYGGYGAQPVAYPAYAPTPKTSGMAIASMSTSIVGAMLLFCYGIGGVVGIVGAILGHVARRQIRERQESGDGMALAGVIIGWITTGIGVLILGAIVFFFVWASNLPPGGPGGGEFDDALRAILAL